MQVFTLSFWLAHVKNCLISCVGRVRARKVAWTYFFHDILVPQSIPRPLDLNALSLISALTSMNQPKALCRAKCLGLRKEMALAFEDPRTTVYENRSEGSA